MSEPHYDPLAPYARCFVCGKPFQPGEEPAYATTDGLPRHQACFFGQIAKFMKRLNRLRRDEAE